MRPLVLHETLPEILLWGTFVLWLALESVLRRRSRTDSVESKEWTVSLIMVLLFVSLVAATVAASKHVAPLPGPAWWPVAAGVVLLWLGIGFRLWAIRTLGRFFKLTVVIQENHRVVESGPYRWLRHPSYTGGLVAATAIGLAEGDWVAIAIMAIGLSIAYLVRIPVEERALLAELGDEYAAYAKRTARLVPGLF